MMADNDSSNMNWTSYFNSSTPAAAAASTAAPAQTSQAELYVVTAILIFLCITGAAGNALVLYVFSQKKDKLVSTLCILVMALVDFITCLVVIPYTIYMENVLFSVSIDAVCKIYQFLITSNIPFSALIMAAIAVDRYFCICHPFLQAMTLPRAKAMIAVLGLFAAGLGVCVSLMYGVYHSVPVPCRQGLQGGDGNGTTSVLAGDCFTTTTAESQRLSTESDNRDEIKENIVPEFIVEYSGTCQPNTLVFNEGFQLMFQKLYYLVFILCLVIVVILYVLIYRSVLDRRTRRQNQKSKSLSLVVATTSAVMIETNEETMETMIENEGGYRASNGKAAKSKGKSAGGNGNGKKGSTSSAKRDMIRMANLKTAAMLFVVTVVFIVTYIPAFLMALNLVPYNMTIFYMYFANNVANPVIYSFMNKNFREDTRRLMCR